MWGEARCAAAWCDVTHAWGCQLTWVILTAQHHLMENWERQGAGAAVLVEKQHNITEKYCK